MEALCWALGLVSVAGTWWFVRRVRRREPDLTGELEGEQDIVHRPTRLAAARKLIAWAQIQLVSARRRLEKLQRRLRDRLPLPEDLNVSGDFYLALAVVAFGGLSAVAWILNASAQIGGLGPEAIAFLSSWLAAAALVFGHGVVYGAIGLGATHRPRQRLVRAKLTALLATAGSLVLLYLVLAGRSIANQAVVDLLSQYGLHALGIVTDIAGAAAFCVYQVLREEQQLGEDVQAAQTAVTTLEKFIAELQADIKAISTPEDDDSGGSDGGGGAVPPVSSPSAGSGGGSSAAAAASIAAAVCILLLGPAANVTLAATLSETMAAPTPVGVATRVVAAGPDVASITPQAPSGGSPTWLMPDACEFAIDVSRSVSTPARQAAIDDLATKHLATLVELFGCRIVRISVFSGDAPFNGVDEVIIPGKLAAADCTPKDTTPHSASERIYPRVRADRLDREKAACQAQQRGLQQGAAAQRDDAIASARGLLQRRAQQPGRGNCTALTAAVSRAARRSGHVWVLTDGQESCTPPPPPGTASASELFFLLLPSGPTLEPDVAVQATALATQLESEYPGAAILFFAEVTPSTWSAFRR